MDEEMRERIVSGVAETMRIVGADSYEEGMQKTANFLGFFHQVALSMKTIDDLRKLLGTASFASEKEKQALLFLAENLPQLLRPLITNAAQELVADLPASPTGRRKLLTTAECHQMAKYVRDLFGAGVPLKGAKLRASQRFQCSIRTVNRIWTSRASLPAEEITLQDVIAIFS